MYDYFIVVVNFIPRKYCSYNVSLRRGDDCRVSLKRENKTAQTLSIVVGGFIACWLPFFIVYLITPYFLDFEILKEIMKWLTWLGERYDIILLNYTYFCGHDRGLGTYHDIRSCCRVGHGNGIFICREYKERSSFREICMVVFTFQSYIDIFLSTEL